ncbi:MAG TPA: hypothetical protein VG963_29035 [Polyangiaceae bacterium]|nr:hypothetical protein [Polyangiaceae bacterium]
MSSQVARFVYVWNSDDTVWICAVDAATNRLIPRGYSRGTDVLATAIATDPSG